MWKSVDKASFYHLFSTHLEWNSVLVTGGPRNGVSRVAGPCRVFGSLLSETITLRHLLGGFFLIRYRDVLVSAVK